MSPEATRVVNYLASGPEFGSTTVDTKVLREILLEVGSNMLARGSLYDFKPEHLGAGIYKLSLKRTN